MNMIFDLRMSLNDFKKYWTQISICTLSPMEYRSAKNEIKVN
jgi:hypothetical protein